MNLNDILNNEEIKTSKQLVMKINKSIVGRVALNNMLQSTHVLYVIKNLLGDNCKNVLEIGTLWGGALLTMMESKHKSKFISIDMFEGFYPTLIGKGSHDGHGINTKEIVTENILNNNPWSHEFELIKGSSHDKKIINYIENNYPNIDLLFIDGDHTKKGVLQDWNDYSSLVTRGGIVVFDDYWVGKYETAAWKTEDDNGVKWMDVVGAVDEIVGDNNFVNQWKDIGLYGDKYILEKI